MNSVIRRLALEEASEAKRLLDHNKRLDTLIVSQITECEICGSESEHVIRSKDGEDRMITCDSDACIDSANVTMDGGE